MARLLVIINPVAGRGMGGRIAPAVEAGLAQHGHQLRIHHSTCSGHARELAGGPDSEWCDGMVACGGDGTIAEVVNGRGDRPVPVGVVPLGTGNVLAKEIGVAARPLEEVLAPIAAWELRAIDMGETGDGRRFTCMVSAGVDGRVIQLLGERRRGGTMRMADYLPLGMRALWESNYGPIEVSVDGDVVGDGFGYACIANTHSFGGPIEMVSDALVDDGLLDAVGCSAWMPLGFPVLLGLALLGQTTRMPSSRFRRGANVRLTGRGRREVPCQIDGEYAGSLPVEARVIPGGLTVFAKGEP